MRLKKIGFFKKSGIKFCLFLSAVLLSFSVSSTSIAQIVTSPCDPEYMDALEARAWMEAQREISQNKNLIFKPDSVLEYTCFDRFLNEAASNWGMIQPFPVASFDRQFSETAHWSGTPAGFNFRTTDTALQKVVMEPFLSYLASNFNTRGNMGAYLNNRRALEYSPQGAVDGTVDYSCAEMQKVWAEARCMNFNETAENNYDGFYDFKYYQSHDPRNEKRPWALTCGTPSNRFEQARKTAFNKREALFDVGTEFLKAEGNSIAYKEDDIVTHLDLILPGSCVGKVPTGITVQRPDLSSTPYAEVVCTNPGCSADPAGHCN